ncbi:MAG: 16S rRNA (guanine(527)-N(7))-methyltransferase RsmG [Actinobacteria bacterium]|nr:16S rRNA (guanine(527)-N(7))-methyltransferase RsmG [Actinomycetota bacterium]
MMLEEKEILINALKEMSIRVCGPHIKKLLKYLDIIWRYNKDINMVGTKDRKGILVRHMLDSLSLLKLKEYILGQGRGKRIIDVGTGAGFPGMVLSIVLEEHFFYLLDSNRKKIDFISTALKYLDIKNTRIICERSEIAAKDKLYRETFDLVLARAVSKMNILTEISIPFCRINGKIVYYKSKKVSVEIAENTKKILLLGGRVEDLREIDVPYLEGYRAFLIIEKIKRTPVKYPRYFARIIKQPL